MRKPFWGSRWSLQSGWDQRGERAEEAHNFMENIDNVMKKFNKQQMDLLKSGMKFAERELRITF